MVVYTRWVKFGPTASIKGFNRQMKPVNNFQSAKALYDYLEPRSKVVLGESCINSFDYLMYAYTENFYGQNNVVTTINGVGWYCKTTAIIKAIHFQPPPHKPFSSSWSWPGDLFMDKDHFQINEFVFNLLEKLANPE